jgi:hypothetical protein
LACARRPPAFFVARAAARRYDGSLARIHEDGVMKSIRIAAPAIAVSLLLAARGAAAQESARIMALGGSAVSGVIADHYTDLYLSPVYALDADNISLWYTRRGEPALAFVSGLPYAGAAVLGAVSGMSYNPSNEAALYGLKLGAWRLALTSRWSFNKDYSDETKSLIQTRWGNEIRTSMRHRDADADAWLLDFAAARPAGGDRIFGLRLRGSGFYNQYCDVSRIRSYSYEDSPFIDLRAYGKYEDGQNYVSRRVALDVQGALGRKRDGRPIDEISVTVSMHRLVRFSQVTDFDLTQRFDSYGGTTHYSRSLIAGVDSREGDMWSLGAAYRRALSGGIRLYTEGSVAILSYDAATNASSEIYYWNYTPTKNDLFSASLSGNGSVVRGAFAARAGKAFALHPTLDLYVTAGGAFVRSACEENPLARYAYREDGEAAFGLEAPVVYAFAETRASLFLPLSIDFHPSSWFSYFAAFVPHAQWSRVTGEEPFASPFVFYPPAAAWIPDGRSGSALSPGQFDEPFAAVERREEAFDTSHSFACGFSLHYEERFSVDVYTRYSVIPSYWNDLAANVRFGF